MTSKIRPMLAARFDPEIEKHKLRYPLYGSPKLDGIRALVVNNEVVSRSLKKIPSEFVQDRFSKFNDVDGELIFEDPIAKDCFNKTTSAVMTHNSTVGVYYYVFDLLHRNYDFELRLGELRDIVKDNVLIKVVEQKVLSNWDDVLVYEAKCLFEGYEGIILRSPFGIYKMGRSTLNEQYMIKLKRFEDSSAIIIGAEELQHNNNEAILDNLGYAKRSSHQDNKVNGNTLGALIVRDLESGIEFNIGSGFDDELKKKLWDDFVAGGLVGRKIDYKHFAYGVVEKPRHPVFLRFREDL